jgi:SAM-dependent methyltransferase
MPTSETRSPERLRYHYAVERELADRLRNSAKHERVQLYKTVYDELFRRVTDHPQLTSPNTASHKAKIANQMRLVAPLLKTDSVFLEIGGGDCALSFQIAPRIKMAYALEITGRLVPEAAPQNFCLILSDGSSIELPAGTVDVAVSFSVVEHVHPEDVVQQLAEIHRVLKPGGIYYCVTPNRLLGPHDISGCFDTVAKGLHLKEYTISELARLYRNAGFQEIWVDKYWNSRRVRVPVPAMRAVEFFVGWLPLAARVHLARNDRLSWEMDVRLIGRKRLD